MAEVIKIPHLNPLHFHNVVTDKFAPDLIPSFEEDKIYLQKFIRHIDQIQLQVQVLTDYLVEISCYLQDVDGNELSLSGFTQTELNDYTILNLSSNTDSIGVGVYYVVLKVTINMGGGDIEKTYVSEPIEVVSSLPESLLINYSHDGNEFETYFYPLGIAESKISLIFV